MEKDGNRPRLTIVIPTYNEGGIIEESLKRVADALGELRVRTEIIIADDGKDDLPSVIDRCGASLGYYGLKVMRNAVRAGKGESIRRAFGVARGEIVGFMDADLYVDPSFINSALGQIAKGCDMSIASREGDRFASDRSVLVSVLGSLFAFISRRLLFGDDVGFSDTQCGFKFFRLEVAVGLYKDLIATDGLTDLEVLIKAKRHGYKVGEVMVPRRRDRDLPKRRLSSILIRETISLGRLIFRYNAALVLGVALIIMSLFFATFRITESPPFWYDEGWYFQSAANLATTGHYGIQFSPGAISGVSFLQTVSYPLTYPLALWFKVFGVSVLSGRLMMALMIVALLVAAYFLSKRLFGRVAALCVLAVLATFPPLYGNGKSILGEVPGLLYLLGFLLSAYAFRTRTSGRYRWLFASALLAGLCMATKPIFFLLAPSIILWLIVSWRHGDMNWKSILAWAAACAVPLVVWLAIQVPGGQSLSSFASFYSNPYAYESASAAPSLLARSWQNFISLFANTNGLYTLAMMIIWAGALFVRRLRKAAVSIEELAAFIFSLLVCLAFLRIGAILRYLFVAQATALIFFPPSLTTLSGLIRPKLRPWAVGAIIAILSAAGLYQLSFDSYVAESYMNRHTEFWQQYFSKLPSSTSVFFYDTPELAALMKGRNYYQLLLSDRTSPLGKESLPAISDGRVDEVIVGESKYEPLKSYLFKGYRIDETAFKYIILKRKS